MVRDPATWATVWSEIQGTNSAAPRVDFNGQMVLVACLGERRVGGYTVEIVSASIDDDTLMVAVRETRPTPDSMQPQIITAPCYAARVARSAAAVRWVSAD